MLHSRACSACGKENRRDHRVQWTNWDRKGHGAPWPDAGTMRRCKPFLTH
jgi:hypothetical protein